MGEVLHCEREPTNSRDRYADIRALNFRKPGHLRKYCNNENFPIYGISWWNYTNFYIIIIIIAIITIKIMINNYIGILLLLLCNYNIGTKTFIIPFCFKIIKLLLHVTSVKP